MTEYEDTDEFVNLKAKAYFKDLLQRIQVREEKFKDRFAYETAITTEICHPDTSELAYEAQFLELQKLKTKLNHFCSIIDKQGKIDFERVYLQTDLSKEYIFIPTKEQIHFNIQKEQIDVYHFYINHFLKNQELNEKITNYRNILKY